MRMRWAAGFCVLATAISLSAATLTRTESFELISTLGPEAVAPAAAHLEQTIRRYRALGLTLREPGPITAVLTPTMVEIAPYAPEPFGRTRGVSLASQDRNYALAAWVAPGDALTALAHEYAHLVDPHPDSPIWFREGLADYLSLLRPDAEGVLRPGAPADRLTLLRAGVWLPLDRLLGAGRGAAELAEPMFYPQSWLIVRWLAERQPDVLALSPTSLADAVAAEGPEAVARRLREFLETLAAEPNAPAPLPTPGLLIETVEDREVAWRLADFDRHLRPDRARGALERLMAEHPGWLAPRAPLGAIAMDAGQYDEAEAHLAEAVRDPLAAARTHHRYALLLLRPTEAHPDGQAELAAQHAARALEKQPGDRRFLLTHAQALMVAGQWDASARSLRRLYAMPEARERAERELEELQRRRNQALRSEKGPQLAAGPTAPLDDELTAALPASVPPPLPHVEPPVTSWPPPGAEIIAGRIDFVDCSGPDKIIVLRSRLFPMRFREPRNRPAKIFFPPDKSWRTIPCGAKGWTINIAYRPYRELGAVRGDVIAILF